MDKKEHKNLKVGDIVVISGQGYNKGKRGIVSSIQIIYDNRSEVYLKPLDGEFIFYNKNIRTKNKDGLYGFSSTTIQFYTQKEKPLLLLIYRFFVCGP